MPEIRELMDAILIEKAFKDEQFRKELVSDPDGVVKRLGIKLPGSMKNLKVVEETPETMVLVLPQRPDQAPSGKLSRNEMESVAGGGITPSWCNSTCVLCTVVIQGC